MFLEEKMTLRKQKLSVMENSSGKRQIRGRTKQKLTVVTFTKSLLCNQVQWLKVIYIKDTLKFLSEERGDKGAKRKATPCVCKKTKKTKRKV